MAIEFDKFSTEEAQKIIGALKDGRINDTEAKDLKLTPEEQKALNEAFSSGEVRIGDFVLVNKGKSEDGKVQYSSTKKAPAQKEKNQEQEQESTGFFERVRNFFAGNKIAKSGTSGEQEDFDYKLYVEQTLARADSINKVMEQKLDSLIAYWESPEYAGYTVASCLMGPTSDSDWELVQRMIRDDITEDNIYGVIKGYTAEEGLGTDLILEQIYTEWGRTEEEKRTLIESVVDKVIAYGEKYPNEVNQDSYQKLVKKYNEIKGTFFEKGNCREIDHLILRTLKIDR